MGSFSVANNAVVEISISISCGTRTVPLFVETESESLDFDLEFSVVNAIAAPSVVAASAKSL